MSASFLERLDAIDAFLTEEDAAFAFDQLLAELCAAVIPNLARCPRVDRRYLNNPPQSVEALAQFAALPAGSASALREYLHGDCLMLYAVMDPQAATVVGPAKFKPRISMVESLVGQVGWMQLSLLELDSFQQEEHLVFTCVTEAGEVIDQYSCEKLFYLSASTADLQASPPMALQGACSIS